MKYFTKYLPVEGEIKEGDKVAWNTKYNHVIGFEGERLHAQLLQADGYKAAKLFLCSRDIRVGDKVYGRDEAIIYTPMGVAFNKPDAYEIVDTDQYFKVIGEISHDALSYVKEGQEFDEEELDFYWNNCMIEGKHISKKEWNEHRKSIPIENLLIKIKCPNCKNFH